MEGMRAFCLAVLIATGVVITGGLLGQSASVASPATRMVLRLPAQVARTEASPTSEPGTPPAQTTRPSISVVPTRAPATSAAPQSQPTTTAAATGASSDSSWWPWIVGAVLVAAVVIGIVLLVRRPRGSGQWPNQAAAVLDESDQITTHLVGLGPSGLVSVAAADASRLATLMASAQQLAGSAPDETSRQALVRVEEPLRSLQGALDLVGLASAPPSDPDVHEVHATAARLHSATALARATIQPSSTAPRA
jgi:hypothetical protein